ncbi:hypothetical protein ACFFF5_10775 [Lederbergia wuyishanensis]|uniref:Uncharacterized protein n=1 Tax=Lederbergia wuyishanensis TaxID=1347903 RepID=A0ABU0D6W1_9BACI|nr:hypothetical protein [Lederbergia wuyishanensis]MCJ8008761.1 hypothetical protein [Lederbergia wuyishanensis]MDQ0344081.1 hypothetical protein [Lederbergia wuyishanensis]
MKIDEDKEKLHIWQPVTNLRGKYPWDINLTNVIRHNDYLKITLEDFHNNNQLDIVYDQNITPLEYYVWAFRFSTEIGRHDLRFTETDSSGRIDPEAAYFCKMENSRFLRMFDSNPMYNRKTHPNLEHHLYITGDEVFEVLSDYEPRFIEKKK